MSLPSTQRHVLVLLRERGSWSVGSPWVVESSTKTRLALKALAHRGLVVAEREGDVLVYRPKTEREFAAQRRAGKHRGQGV